MDVSFKQSVKGYDLRDQIGVGGFGSVYRAYQSAVGREVAIKIILPAHANQPDFIRRFEGEAQLVARLEHPHITPLYDYWRDPDGAYLVMRWLRGGSLRDALESGAFELRSAAQLLEQIAGALSLAHRNDVIHRDVKPANILLDEDGNAYLTDFGIAKDLNLPSANTQADAIVGSLDYISPEQARSEPVTPRTDIYSLGVTMYEVISGHHPFQNLSAIERLYKHINDPLPDLEGFDPDIQTRLNEVIQKATAKDPANRYPDALAFAADFREAIGLNRTSTTMIELLTQREHEILALVIEGLSNKEIAQKLTVSLNTVKWYVTQIYTKMSVRNRVQAIVRARELNLIGKGGAVPTTAVFATEDFFPENPYKGLRAFTTADHNDFFGREKLIEKLIHRLGEVGEYQRFLAVIGPSGSGKSSLVKAGLIPSIWRGALHGSDKWFVVEMLPGARPLDALEIALTKVAANHARNLNEQLVRDAHGLMRAADMILPNDGSELLLVIDQFEEVFTLVEDEGARQHFLDLIYAAVTTPRSRVRVVVTLRADFYDRPLHYPQMGDMLRTRLETILPLSAEELEWAITRPAHAVGIAFEQGLVSTIVSDVKYQAGALPLLQYALTELFEQRKGHLLTREAYQAIGGTIGALAKRAEELYRDSTVPTQEAIKQLFLRLVTLGEGTEDTRRRTLRTELLAISANPDTMEEVIDVFSGYRLLALDTDPATRNPTVEVAHEALLREWERLRAWLNDSREDIKLQRQLSAMATEWQNAKQDASFLISGSRLEQFSGWANNTSMSLTLTERDFLQKSVVYRDETRALDAERKQRESQLEKQSQTFLRGLVAVLAVGILVAFGLTGVAVNQSNQTQQALATSDANFQIAQSQSRIAQVRELVGYANANLEKDAELSTLLALQAVNMTYRADGDVLPEAETVLHQALQGLNMPLSIKADPYNPGDELQFGFTPDGRRVIYIQQGWTPQNPVPSLMGVADSISGELLYTVAGFPLVDVILDNRAITLGVIEEKFVLLVWDVSSSESGTLLETISLPISLELEFDWIDVTPDLRYLSIYSQSQDTQIFDIRTGEEILVEFINPESRGDATFNPDSSILTNRNPDGSLSIYDTSTWVERIRLTPRDGGFSNFRFSENGRYLVAANRDSSVSLYDLSSGEEVYFVLDFRPDLVALNKDGSRLAASSSQGQVIVLNTNTQQEIVRFSAPYIDRMNFNVDGTRLAALKSGTLQIWDLVPNKELVSFVSTGINLQGSGWIEYSPDGSHLITAGVNTTPMVWDAQTGNSVFRLSGHTANVLGVDWSSDGTRIATASEDKDVKVWDASDGKNLLTLSGHTDGLYSVAFSPDSTKLASSGFDKTVRVWDIATGELLLTLQQPTSSKGVAWSPDGTRIVAGTDKLDVSGHILIWNALTGEQQLDISVGNTRVGTVLFSPDGERILAAMLDIRQGTLWDAQSGEQILTFSNQTGVVSGVAYNADSTLIATASHDGTVRLWDANTGNELLTLYGSPEGVARVVFSPDGKHLASLNMDGTTRIYLVHVEDLIALAKSRLTRTLTDAECQRYLHIETCPAQP